MISTRDGAKLTQLDVTIHCQQDVVRFDISMNDTLGMQMLETAQSLVKMVSISRSYLDTGLIILYSPLGKQLRSVPRS